MTQSKSTTDQHSVENFCNCLYTEDVHMFTWHHINVVEITSSHGTATSAPTSWSTTTTPTSLASSPESKILVLAKIALLKETINMGKLKLLFSFLKHCKPL